MTSVDLTPLYRSSIGFDYLASLIDYATDTSVTGYPSYNIEALDENRYAITLTVAGFSEEELNIQVEKDVLTISGKRASKDDVKYLYQGISDRSFECRFNLADYVEITGADLAHGLLTISFVKEIPEAIKPKTIAINKGAPHLENKIEEKCKSETSKVA
ncbi:MAG: Hsp20 family protein [Oleispira sp.]|jgi:molecular chaperone IbpA|nr:Hsp20 family protein [Oleispira sp.]